jgi:hypothetical protein
MNSGARLQVQNASGAQRRYLPTVARSAIRLSGAARNEVLTR